MSDILPLTFTFPDIGYIWPEALVAALQAQSALASWFDDLGNIQSAVRLELADGVYTAYTREGVVQADIDAALAAYPATVAELHPAEG